MFLLKNEYQTDGLIKGYNMKSAIISYLNGLMVIALLVCGIVFADMCLDAISSSNSANVGFGVVGLVVLIYTSAYILYNKFDRK